MGVNETTVSQDSRGYYKTSIPVGMADALGLEKGDTLKWSVESARTIQARVNDD